MVSFPPLLFASTDQNGLVDCDQDSHPWDCYGACESTSALASLAEWDTHEPSSIPRGAETLPGTLRRLSSLVSVSGPDPGDAAV